MTFAARLLADAARFAVADLPPLSVVEYVETAVMTAEMFFFESSVYEKASAARKNCRSLAGAAQCPSLVCKS